MRLPWDCGGYGYQNRSSGIGFHGNGLAVGQEGFDISRNCILSHGDCFVACVALGVTTGQRGNVRDESTGLVVCFENHRIGKSFRDHMHNYIRTEFLKGGRQLFVRRPPPLPSPGVPGEGENAREA
jgi:hypothetical protein